MVEVNRRGFLATAATAAVAALAEDEKLTDGGYADVSLPGVPTRTTPLVPPGAEGLEIFARRCVGCQLCVAQCPNLVLRPLPKRYPGAPLEAMQPVMGFERGYCRPECTACGDVCPAGAIRGLLPRQKKSIRIGHAVWNKELCLAAAEGVALPRERHHPSAGESEGQEVAEGAEGRRDEMHRLWRVRASVSGAPDASDYS